MTKYKAQVGHHIIVNAPNNFYFGREAVVKSINPHGGAQTVYMVEVPAANGGAISFGLSENCVKELKYKD